MSNTNDSVAAGSTFQQFRLIERIGDSDHAWLAEDTRRDTKVVVKILSRTVPKDKARRDAALKDIRNKVAMRHEGIASVLQVDIDNEVLWMALG